MEASTMKSRVIKLQDCETVRFLELYASEKVLYDTRIEKYKDRDMRMAAAQRISDALQIPGFGPKAILAKFKNLRSSYCQELKKIADSERLGECADDVYRPKVFWFEQMNAFIRPFVQQRPTQSNPLLPTNQNEQSQLEQSQSPPQRQSIVNDTETVPSESKRIRLVTNAIKLEDEDEEEAVLYTPHITAETEIPRISVKRKIPLSVPQPSPLKIKKACIGHQIDCMSGPIENVDDVLNGVARITKEDSYDCFGKYVASMLRSIGPPIALRLQETITSVIINAICPPASSSNQSTPPRSRAESNTSCFSD